MTILPISLMMFNCIKKLGFILFITIACLCFGKTASAQYYFYDDSYYDSPLIFEVGISVGPMNSLTDLGGKKGVGAKFFKDLNVGNTEFSGGFYLGLLYKYMLGLRLEASVGKVSAYDSILSKVTDIARARYNRNLSFRSSITEVALIAEFHPLYAFVDYAAKDYAPPRFSPFIMAGVGYFSFNPQAKLNNQWVNLQPLSTEGQGFAEYPDRKPYKLSAMTIPVGGGVKYELSSLLNLRVEFMYRATTTDYLDDVSTRYIDENLFPKYLSGARLNNALLLHDRNRGEYIPQTLPGKKRGNIKDKDNYFSFNVKIGLVLGKERIR